ncbi:MAG: hypothetical protein ABL915_04940 [Gallionella sp.]
MIAIILLGVAVVAGFYAVGLYNHLVSVKHAVAKAWANIDVLLKQRHDELPKLVVKAANLFCYEMVQASV